jgi:hypothetical protein
VFEGDWTRAECADDAIKERGLTKVVKEWWWWWCARRVLVLVVKERNSDVKWPDQGE